MSVDERVSLEASLRVIERELLVVSELTDEFAGWTDARVRLRDVVGDLVAIQDLCRRVLAGEQDLTPERALEVIQTEAAAALARVAGSEHTTRGEGI